jgi:hypothetical protein
MTQRERSAKYVVTCDCDEQSSPRILALIDDDRAVGGQVRVEALTTAKRTARNHRGGIINAYSQCGGPCGRSVNVSEVTTAHVLDRIAPQGDQLAGRVVPTADTAGADPIELDAWRVQRHAQIAAELAGGPGSEPILMPAPQREEQRIEIPLGLWCAVVTKLPKDRWPPLRNA